MCSSTIILQILNSISGYRVGSAESLSGFLYITSPGGCLDLENYDGGRRKRWALTDNGRNPGEYVDVAGSFFVTLVIYQRSYKKKIIIKIWNY